MGRCLTSIFNAELLMEESLVPVMSPGYLNSTFSSCCSIPDLIWKNVTLLHDAMPWEGALKEQEWHYWAVKHKLDLDVTRGHFFNRTDMAMAAAEAGVGVALARKALLGDDINQKRLVTPFSAIRANAGYFIITHSNTPDTHLFKLWLKQQVVID